MQKKYLKTYYYAIIQYKGFYKRTKEYDSLKELEKYLNLYKNHLDRDRYSYPMIDYVILIKHLKYEQTNNYFNSRTLL